jgi:hypothetical protein
MTPQEKAKELVGNFCNVEFLKDYEREYINKNKNLDSLIKLINKKNKL